jgi:hypothetical protein
MVSFLAGLAVGLLIGLLIAFIVRQHYQETVKELERLLATPIGKLAKR